MGIGSEENTITIFKQEVDPVPKGEWDRVTRNEEYGAQGLRAFDIDVDGADNEASMIVNRLRVRPFNITFPPDFISDLKEGIRQATPKTEDVDKNEMLVEDIPGDDFLKEYPEIDKDKDDRSASRY